MLEIVESPVFRETNEWKFSSTVFPIEDIIPMPVIATFI
jgi:hypothetical protein